MLLDGPFCGVFPDAVSGVSRARRMAVSVRAHVVLEGLAILGLDFLFSSLLEVEQESSRALDLRLLVPVTAP